MIKSNITGELYPSPIEAFNAYCHAQMCDECPFNTDEYAKVTACYNYSTEYPDKTLKAIDCEEVEPYYIDQETGQAYASLRDAFNEYCRRFPDCENCYFRSIEHLFDTDECYEYLSHHIKECLPRIGYAEQPLNGQNTEIDDQDTEVPALCELFHVLPNEDFYIQDTDGSLFLDAPDSDPYAAPMVCRIDNQGLPTQTTRYEGEPNEDEMDGWTIARVINGDLHIIRKSRVWTDQDVADARAVRRIFPSAWYVERLPHSLNLTVGTLSSSPFEEPPLLKPLVIPINPKYFPSVREGETAYITIIKEEDDNNEN